MIFDLLTDENNDVDEQVLRILACHRLHHQTGLGLAPNTFARVFSSNC